jgi:primase-polymerase (primpol)-like protein
MDSYTEITPSGRGLHILVRGDLPSGRRRKGGIEMYQKGHYFTVTGRHLEGTPITINSRGKELKRLHPRIFGREFTTPGIQSRAFERRQIDLSDSELIQKAEQAKNGDKFSRLWSGDCSGHPSPSEADLALCCILAFWTARDPRRIDRLFRQSGLMRAKWDEPRGEETVGQINIQKAIAKTREVYSPRKRRTRKK